MNVIQCAFTIGKSFASITIRDCMESVKSWARNNNHHYTVVDDYRPYIHMINRHKNTYDFFRSIHEHVFIEHLANVPQTICIDFDVKLPGDFVFEPGAPVYSMNKEHFLYNGDDTNFFQKIRNEMTNDCKTFSIYRACCKLGITKSERDYPKRYTHLNYSQKGD